MFIIFRYFVFISSGLKIFSQKSIAFLDINFSFSGLLIISIIDFANALQSYGATLIPDFFGLYASTIPLVLNVTTGFPSAWLSTTT